MVIIAVREVEQEARLDSGRKEYIATLQYKIRKKVDPKSKHSENVTNMKDIRFGLGELYKPYIISVEYMTYEGKIERATLEQFACMLNKFPTTLKEEIINMLEKVVKDTDSLQKEFDMPACVKLKQIRNKCKLQHDNGINSVSIAELANILNIPIITLQKWEAGKQSPPQYLIDLIDFYLKHRYFVSHSKLKLEEKYNLNER